MGTKLKMHKRITRKSAFGTGRWLEPKCGADIIGQLAIKKHTTTEWGKVTCKKCLKKREVADRKKREPGSRKPLISKSGPLR